MMTWMDVKKALFYRKPSPWTPEDLGPHWESQCRWWFANRLGRRLRLGAILERRFKSVLPVEKVEMTFTILKGLALKDSP